MANARNGEIVSNPLGVYLSTTNSGVVGFFGWLGGWCGWWWYSPEGAGWVDNRTELNWTEFFLFFGEYIFAVASTNSTALQFLWNSDSPCGNTSINDYFLVLGSMTGNGKKKRIEMKQMNGKNERKKKRWNEEERNFISDRNVAELVRRTKNWWIKLERQMNTGK